MVPDVRSDPTEIGELGFDPGSIQIQSLFVGIPHLKCVPPPSVLGFLLMILKGLNYG